MRQGILYAWMLSTAIVSFAWSAGAGDINQEVSFAIVIGSNRPGVGQEALSFATRDAERFSAVISELGGYSPERIIKLDNPSGSEVRGALDEMHRRVARHAEAGQSTSFVFYYSGHARAAGLNVGADELSLKELRDRLHAMPAKLKLVLLDACQTGAISNVKGVEPTADFSYNSVAGLTREGTAVMASSSASELAQESPRLEGSFFTHHLVAALRGAADANRDGLVTLDEAYRYTYNRTLVDTAKTAVGKQHVTLETELSGEGETVLSRPGGASAWLALPSSFAGEVLIYRASDKQVMAEIHKAKSDLLRLALPPASYDAVVRETDRAFQCRVEIRQGMSHVLDLSNCDRIHLEKLAVKGVGPRRKEHLFFEVGIGAAFGRQDDYNDRLHDFGFSGTNEGDPIFHLAVSGYYSVLRYLKVGIQYSFLDEDSYEAKYEKFSWRAQRIGIAVRGVWPLAHDWLNPYLQASFGVAFAATHYTNTESSMPMGDETGPFIEDTERFAGFNASGGGGVQLTPWQWAGFFWQAEYIYAPVIENLLGDTHDSGGVALATGLIGGF